MTNFVTHSELSSFLKLNKNEEIKYYIYNLNPDTLRDKEKFDNVLDKTEEKFLLSPVHFEDPQIGDHLFKDNKFIFPVTINFSGSRELFNYIPNGFSFTTSPKELPMIAQPNTNSISFDVSIPVYDIKRVEAEIERQMRLTKILVAGNNNELIQWNTNTENFIISTLNGFRDRL
jgi:hypothetical protein